MSGVIRIFATLGIGLTVFIGLPFLGWGLADIRSFLADPGRLSYLGRAPLPNTIISIRLPEVGKQREKGLQTVPRLGREPEAVAAVQSSAARWLSEAPECIREPTKTGPPEAPTGRQVASGAIRRSARQEVRERSSEDATQGPLPGRHRRCVGGGFVFDPPEQEGATP
jgi:hypothetical protein